MNPVLEEDMTRFDAAVRLQDLRASAKPGPWLVYHDPAIRCPTCKTEADARYMMAMTHAPWIIEVAACFQPRDAALMGEILLLHREFEKDYPDENPGWSDLFARMEKAAAIMEELE